MRFTPIQGQAKGWSIVVEELRDGPNDYTWGSRMHYVPADGARFLWVTMRLRNDHASTRTFNYDRCGLDAASGELLPAFVDRGMFIRSLAPDVEDFAPGEERARRLAFNYPEDRFPTRMACGEIVIPFSLNR